MGHRSVVVTVWGGLLLSISGCSSLSVEPVECEGQLEVIELEAIAGDDIVEARQAEEGWGYELRDVEAAQDPRGACETLRFRGQEELTERTITVSVFPSAARAQRAYDRAAFWIARSDVWDSPDDLYWSEALEQGTQQRYECYFSLRNESCVWRGYALNGRYFVTLGQFRGSEDEVRAYLGQLVDTPDIQALFEEGSSP